MNGNERKILADLIKEQKIMATHQVETHTDIKYIKKNIDEMSKDLKKVCNQTIVNTEEIKNVRKESQNAVKAIRREAGIFATIISLIIGAWFKLKGVFM